MSSGALISVIVTCYNQGKFLKDSLDSLLKQSHINWEGFIINDGSSDETENIALEYCKKDPRFNYFYQSNSGVSSARNLGINKCKGDFIQFLDADDFIHPEKLSTQLDILNLNEKIDIVYGSSRYFFDDQIDVLYPLHFRGSVPCDITFRDNFQVEMLLKHNICTNCSALIRKEVLKKVKFRNIIYEDWVFNLECTLNGFVFHFDNSFSSYSYIRITDSSQMMKHTNQVSEIRMLNSALMGLVKEYNYKVSEKIIISENSRFSVKFINIIRLITPPFIFSMGSSLKRILFP
ncbi:MAG: glycosyltransferase family 2 protein [Algoriphagus sp.]|nr:glycosyltransferase family 2 protein [Algoriphagus sp.]